MSKLEIFLCDLNHDFRSNHYCAPLNVGFVAASLKAAYGSDLNIRLFKSPTRLVEVLNSEGAPHVIGLSNYSWNQELNRFFERRLGERHPETVIVQGGPHIRIDSAGISSHLSAHPQVDYYAMFEGEFSMAELVGAFLSEGRLLKPNQIKHTIPGVAYLRDGELQYVARETRKGDLDAIPSPYLTGIMDEFITSPMYMPILETNRGCPFACTFCAWGVNVLNKVRKFSLERVSAEIDYLAARSPATQWYFSDANFGMFERDIDIARALRAAADRNPNLRGFAINWAKNSSRYCTEIASILRGVCDPLAAVQSTDPVVLRNVKRDNIRMSTVTDLVEQGRRDGIAMTTDVLVGLAGETFDSHMTTLRDVFAIGFESFNVGPIRLLPGSEMETEEYRKRFGIQTRFRLIDGFYGIYDGEPVVEYEESVVGTASLSREEMFSIRQIHFLTWALWNSGLAQPLLRHMYLAEQINPLDAILTLMSSDVDPEIRAFMDEYKSDVLTEWFDSAEELLSYAGANINEVINKGYRKYNLKYLAKLLLDSGLSRKILDTIAARSTLPVSAELSEFSYERAIFFDGDRVSKTKVFSPELLEAVKLVYPSYSDATDSQCNYSLSDKMQRAISVDLERHGFSDDKIRALALALQNFGTKMFYDFSFGTGHRLENAAFPDSFDYENQIRHYSADSELDVQA